MGEMATDIMLGTPSGCILAKEQLTINPIIFIIFVGYRMSIKKLGGYYNLHEGSRYAGSLYEAQNVDFFCKYWWCHFGCCVAPDGASSMGNWMGSFYNGHGLDGSEVEPKGSSADALCNALGLASPPPVSSAAAIDAHP
jgi:hypothetical protein